ncbi:hypothetical protein JOB18_038818 [Solea senegalensis]|uniref:Uncharacterized protein n=1 Tax=Solea senegalensis TaxID=28829 RepID=A0AAV6STV7_SOLSE|nr:hypothetical protein JOB18_038818 [Solea senegalensis]
MIHNDRQQLLHHYHTSLSRFFTGLNAFAVNNHHHVNDTDEKTGSAASFVQKEEEEK